MAPLLDEVQNLRNVWAELATVDHELEVLKETPWTAVVPRKIKTVIEENLLHKLKNMPAKLRQYEAYDGMVNNLKDLVKLNVMITDLKSDALKERHWKKIFQQLGLTIQMSELTLGHMWDADLRRRQVELTEILAAAAGEMALEEFMKAVKDCWSDMEVRFLVFVLHLRRHLGRQLCF